MKITEQDRLEFLHAEYVDIVNRIIYMYGDVTELSIQRIVKQLHYFESADQATPITIYISSRGGVEIEMLSLYDTIIHLESPVFTIGVGKVFSAAPLILAAGDYREIYPNTRVMMHEGTIELDGGSMQDVSVEVGYIAALTDTWCELMATHTKKKKAFWSKMCDHRPDEYMTAEQCLKLGVVDAIIGS